MCASFPWTGIGREVMLMYEHYLFLSMWTSRSVTGQPVIPPDGKTSYTKCWGEPTLKGTFKGLQWDQLGSALPPVSVSRLGYFHRVCAIIDPSSPECNLIVLLINSLSILSFVSFCIYLILHYHCKTTVFLFRCWKVGINTSWIFTHHRSVLDVRIRDTNYF